MLCAELKISVALIYEPESRGYLVSSYKGEESCYRCLGRICEEQPISLDNADADHGGGNARGCNSGFTQIAKGTPRRASNAPLQNRFGICNNDASLQKNGKEVRCTRYSREAMSFGRH